MENATIYSVFKAVVKRQPDLPAVIDDSRTVTYGELDAMADAIMAQFYAEAPAAVGIVMNHGVLQIAAMLAVLKSGAAYVPAEPSLPQERVDYMMETAGATLVLTDAYCRRAVSDGASGDMADRSAPDGLAYILYTSGTSGKPKGVMIENHSVVNYAAAFNVEFSVGPGDRMLQYSVCSFDIFVEEVFAILLNGAIVCVPPPAVRNASIPALMEFVERHGVTILDGFPYLLAEINKLDSLPPSVRLIISGGDVIRASYIDRLTRSGVKIYNTYGPSETTVCSNYYRVDNSEPLPDGTYPIGKPMAGVSVHILDEKLREVAPGDIGEICIAGEGLARGYAGNPPEQVNFTTLPDGSRIYRSGDLGRTLPDGNMVFLRRRDSQVMIMGRRVEPEEVEDVLDSCPWVDRGVVHANIDDNGLAYLTAYLVPREGCRLSFVREWLAARLADYMVPEFFVALKELPLTRRGKVDVAALPVVMKEGGV